MRRAIAIVVPGLVSAVVLALVLAVGPLGVAFAQTSEPTTSVVADAGSGQNGPTGANGANTPQPVGRAEPPKSQRALDSFVWLWVMVVLVGGGLTISILSRRHRPEHADEPPTA